MGKDILGGFHIPEHLKAKTDAYVPPTPPKPKAKPKSVFAKPTFKLTASESVIEKIKSTSSKSSNPPIHTVSGHIDNYSGKAVIKCTCQGYRIQGRGYCKHTKLMEAKYDFVPM